MLEIWSYQEIQVICAHKNVVELLLIIPADKNLEQRDMKTEDHEQPT